MAAPQWQDIPQAMRDEFLLQGKIELHNWYINETDEQKPPFWSNVMIEQGVNVVKSGGMLENIRCYGEESIRDLYRALAKYPIEGKKVLILGSRRPWIEVVCIAYNASSITTVEYNPPKCTDPRLRIISVDQHSKEDIQYDFIFSFSSLEHDGLGRYGDPLNPNADIARMTEIRNKLRNDGLFFLAVPIGYDILQFNAHRIYGPIRFQALLNEGSEGQEGTQAKAKWIEENTFSESRKREDYFQGQDSSFQPWFVLKKNLI
jgi:hypothetical protein